MQCYRQGLRARIQRGADLSQGLALTCTLCVELILLIYRTLHQAARRCKWQHRIANQASMCWRVHFAHLAHCQAKAQAH